jgi:hypothetical protein
MTSGPPKHLAGPGVELPQVVGPLRAASTPTAAVAPNFLYVNFARPHKSLASPYPRTPAVGLPVVSQPNEADI